MTPDASTYDPRPEYMADLIDSSGLSQPALGLIIGVDQRTIRRWRSGERQFTYLQQFGMECLVLSV